MEMRNIKLLMSIKLLFWVVLYLQCDVGLSNSLYTANTLKTASWKVFAVGGPNEDVEKMKMGTAVMTF